MTTLTSLFQNQCLIFVLLPIFRRITLPPGHHQQNCKQIVLILKLQMSQQNGKESVDYYPSLSGLCSRLRPL